MMTGTHAELRWMALRWLTVRATHTGIRGATEVPIAKGYVADAAALCGLQGRYHERLCHQNGLVPKTVDPVTGEETGDVPDYYSVIFEAKITRSDYLKTFGGEDRGRYASAANLHYIVTPRGLLRSVEVPNFWGLLEISGSGLTEAKHPWWRPRTEAQQDHFAHSLIWPLLKRRQEWRQPQLSGSSLKSIRAEYKAKFQILRERGTTDEL